MNCNTFRNFHEMTFRWKTYRFFVAIFEGKIQGIFYCNRWGDGHLWSGRNGLKWFTAFKPLKMPLKKMPLDPKRTGNCSSSKKNTKIPVRCCYVYVILVFREVLFAARFSFGGISHVGVLEDTSDTLPRRWRGDPVSWTEPVSWDQVVVENKMDLWCCLTKTQKNMKKMDSMDSIQFLIQFWQWFWVLIHEKMDSMIEFNS